LSHSSINQSSIMHSSIKQTSPKYHQTALQIDITIMTCFRWCHRNYHTTRNQIRYLYLKNSSVQIQIIGAVLLHGCSLECWCIIHILKIFRTMYTDRRKVRYHHVCHCFSCERFAPCLQTNTPEASDDVAWWYLSRVAQ
jgi:hypothetical protein